MKKTSACLLTIFLLSVLYNCLYNWHFLRLWSEGRWVPFAQYMVTAIVMVFGLFLVLSASKAVLSVSLPLIFVVSAAADHFITEYQIRSFSLNTVGFAFETNLEEASGFIGQTLILWTLGGTAVALAVAIALMSYLAHIPWKARVTGIVSSLVVSVVLHFSTKGPMALPFNVFESTFSYLHERYEFKTLSENKEDISEGASYFGGEELVVVLIIGESARADHFHINGYCRQTSPNLERLGVLSFSRVKACGASTRIAVPCMMTRANRTNMELADRETSLISVFRRLGFHTVWLSNQRFLGKANTKVSAIAKEAEVVFYNDKQADNVYMRLFDEDLLGPFREALWHPSPRKLIIFHTVGSHWHYDQHYTDQFRVFEPVCREKSQRECALEEVVNAYDNTILYTEYRRSYRPSLTCVL